MASDASGAEPAFNGLADATHNVNCVDTTSSATSDPAALTSGSAFIRGSSTTGPENTSTSPPLTSGLGDGGDTLKIVPPTHPYRTLVLCFDGTGDQFDQDNSNVVEFFSILKKDDPGEQLVYYQAGIGTYTSPKIATPFFASVSKALDEMVAWNLDAHIMSGYEFLMQNYRAKDRICIFGFSRGAYTARCLAGMLHKVGLLPTCNFQQVPFAYKMYTRTDAVGWKQSNLFKKAFSIDVNIEFLGVWDTVSSVGIISRRLPFTTSNTVVNTFRHAIALDERRAKFKANLWNRTSKKEQKMGLSEFQHGYVKDIAPDGTTLMTSPTSATMPNDQQPPEQVKEPLIKSAEKTDNNGHHHPQPHHAANVSAGFAPTLPGAGAEALSGLLSSFGAGSGKGIGKNSTLSMKTHERKWNKDRDAPTDIEEVWFAGCHCDIGGGSVTNGITPCLARIPLRWMIRECFKTKSGIQFHADVLRAIGLNPATLHPVVLPRPPALSPRDATTGQLMKILDIPTVQRTIYDDLDNDSDDAPLHHLNVNGIPETEEEYDLKDALAPIYDRLSLSWIWWVLEVMPIRHRVQVEGEARWEKRWSMNLGRGRELPGCRHGRKQPMSGEGSSASTHKEMHKVRVHRSVKTRIESEHEDKSKYWPKATGMESDFSNIIWVD